MKVLVTGANGLLATNTIIELLGQGYTVTGLLRDKEKFLLPPHQNLELIEGDILNADITEQAIQKCHYLIHIAAETRQNLINYKDYYKTNVEGPANLIQAAIKYKLKKFILISTVNTIGYGTKNNPGTEKDSIKEPFSSAYYAQSKLQSQEIVLSRSHEIDVVVINPTFLIGPYDSKPGSGRIILMNYGKKIIFYPPGGKNFVHVSDAARGIVSALQNGKNGEIYLLANENLTYKEFFQKLALITDSQAVLVKIPKYILLLIGIIGNILKFAGIRNEITLTNMRILCVNNFYSGQKAQNELNIKFTKIEFALKDAVNWFKDNKMIK